MRATTPSSRSPRCSARVPDGTFQAIGLPARRQCGPLSNVGIGQEAMSGGRRRTPRLCSSRLTERAPTPYRSVTSRAGAPERYRSAMACSSPAEKRSRNHRDRDPSDTSTPPEGFAVARTSWDKITETFLSCSSRSERFNSVSGPRRSEWIVKGSVSRSRAPAPRCPGGATAARLRR